MKHKTIITLVDNTKLHGLFGGTGAILDNDSRIPRCHSVSITIGNRSKSIEFSTIKDVEIEIRDEMGENNPMTLTNIDVLRYYNVSVKTTNKIEDKS